MNVFSQREQDSNTTWTAAASQADIWLARIAEQLKDLRFGSLNIVVHDGRIVQIDRMERHRYDSNEFTSTVKEKGVQSHERKSKKKF